MALKATTFVTRASGEAGCVLVTEDVDSALKALENERDTLSVQRTRELNRYFDKFASNGERFLQQEVFKKEGNYPSGSASGEIIGVWAFKARKYRLYGAIVTMGGKKCFIGTRIDDSKKQDKADRNLLKATAKDIGKFLATEAKAK